MRWRCTGRGDAASTGGGGAGGGTLPGRTRAAPAGKENGVLVHHLPTSIETPEEGPVFVRHAVRAVPRLLWRGVWLGLDLMGFAGVLAWLWWHPAGIAAPLWEAVPACGAIAVLALLETRIAGLPESGGRAGRFLDVLLPLMATGLAAALGDSAALFVTLACFAALRLAQGGAGRLLARHGWCRRTMLVAGESLAATHAVAMCVERRSGMAVRALMSTVLPPAMLGDCAHAAAAALSASWRYSGADMLVLAMEPAPGEAMLGLAQLLAAGSFRVVALRVLGERAVAAGRAPQAWPGLPDLPRLRDAVLASLALLALAPLLLAVALAIWLEDRGPVFFRQERLGRGGAPFLIWKFRTMRWQNRPGGAFMQTMRDDPRVTRVGRFLRRSSLDELPQLINVVAGDMAIVGPRPHATDMTVGGQALEAVAGDYAARHLMRPGITGWAQVNGSRGAVLTEGALRRRLALDLYYVETQRDARSFWMDIHIMLRTLRLLWADRHAF